MKYFNNTQAKAVDNIKGTHIVIQEETFFTGEGTNDEYNVELLCEMQDAAYAPLYYRCYTIRKNGETSYIDYKPAEESGDESFDVVVEREMKKEEKKVIDLRETYAELIESYIYSHGSELAEYAEDCKREAFESYAEESLQDVIETVISNYYDNYTDFDEVTFNDEDIEQLLIDNGILD